jgi:hypothetical protein
MFSNDAMEVYVLYYAFRLLEATFINVKRPKGTVAFIDVIGFYYYYIYFLIGNFIVKK